MNIQFCQRLLRAVTVSAFTFGLLSPIGVYAAIDDQETSTATVVGAVTCGADATTPAGNAVVSVAGVNVQTRTDGDGRFTLSGVPAGQQLRIDAANDPQQSSMSSRFNVVTQPGQTLDIGSIDLAICPAPGAPTDVTTDWDMDQRPSPN